MSDPVEKVPLMHYDQTDPQSIESFAKRLEGHSMRKMLVQEERPEYSVGKGRYGVLMEQEYFGINPGNSPLPDFEAAGVELKTTPLKRKGRRLVAKERLVLQMIDYVTVHSEEWETSTFLRKNGLLLIIFYLWECDLDPWDYVVKIARLWSIPDEDREIIRDDWETIIGKVRDGLAHEISEGDTLYLAACVKAAKGSDRRPQPFSDELAKPRAFSLKQSYMNSVIDESLRLQSIASTAELSAGRSLEEIVHARFALYFGLTADEIADRIGLDIQRGAKNFYSVLTKRVLGVDPANRIAEFEKADIQVKTMRLKPNGTPKEDVSFPAFKYVELVEEDWEASDLRERLTKRFFFVVFQLDRDGVPTLLRTQFWAMPAVDLEGCARGCWETTVRRILEGRAEDLPKKSDNRCCHVRPHGRDSGDTLPTPQGDLLVRKSFWLNGQYLRDQLLGGGDS